MSAKECLDFLDFFVCESSSPLCLPTRAVRRLWWASRLPDWPWWAPSPPLSLLLARARARCITGDADAGPCMLPPSVLWSLVPSRVVASRVLFPPLTVIRALPSLSLVRALIFIRAVNSRSFRTSSRVQALGFMWAHSSLSSLSCVRAVPQCLSAHSSLSSLSCVRAWPPLSAHSSLSSLCFLRRNQFLDGPVGGEGVPVRRRMIILCGCADGVRQGTGLFGPSIRLLLISSCFLNVVAVGRLCPSALAAWSTFLSRCTIRVPSNWGKASSVAGSFSRTLTQRLSMLLACLSDTSTAGPVWPVKVERTQLY